MGLWLCFSILAGMLAAGRAECAEARPQRAQGQLDVTVIHVDRLGIYVPNIVFYWDTGMGKQKLATLTAAAEKLRNKRAILTYSAEGSPTTDRRPLVVDIAPHQEPAQPYDTHVTISGGSDSQVDGASASDPYPARDIDSPKVHGTEGPDLEDHPSATDDDLEATAQTSAQSLPIQKRDALMLVEHILHLTGKKALDSILYYYGDTVNYYARGDVPKDYIRRDLGYYFKNWDRIRSSLEGDIQLIETSRPDIKVVRFQSSYEVENAKRTVAGTTDNTWKVQRTRTGLKVIDQKQSVVSSRTVDKP